MVPGVYHAHPLRMVTHGGRGCLGTKRTGCQRARRAPHPCEYDNSSNGPQTVTRDALLSPQGAPWQTPSSSAALLAGGVSAACSGKVTCEQQETGTAVPRRSRRAAVREVVVCLRQGQAARCRGAGGASSDGEERGGKGAAGGEGGVQRRPTGSTTSEITKRPHCGPFLRSV